MYYALYRKYRPKTFSEVIGQEHVTKTLKNQIENNQFSHAYLFTGTRGTGKTSCAKIFARAVNCLNPSKGEPCNQCEVCKGLLDGSIYDVIEIDAASNNGVENIRQIRDEIVYTPVKAKYKVYIIDEVHMLSTGAFNALLKTLEEPPSYVIFILATTEAHKIPATILSRCQRFDMLRLNINTISKQVRNVLEWENRNMSEDIIRLIADLADGSVRDALSILDKVLELENPAEIKQILGIIDKKTLNSLCEKISEGNIGEIYDVISDLYAGSRDLGLFCHDLLIYFREILIVKTAKNSAVILEKSVLDIEALKKSAEGFTTEHVLYAMNDLEQTIQLLPRSIDKRATVEICMLKLASPSLNNDYQSLQVRISRIEERIKNNFEHSVIGIKKEKNVEVKADENKSLDISIESEASTNKVSENPELLIQSPESEPIEETEIPKKIVTEPNITLKFKELISWKVITDEIRKIDRRLSLTLSRCNALYKDKEILIVCQNNIDMPMLKDPKNIEIINRTLEEDRKIGYSVKIVLGNKDDYLKEDKDTMTYQNIENNELFKF